MSPQFKVALFGYLAFLGGEIMFLFKRASLVAQSETNPTSTVWAFIWRNKITIVVRWFCAFIMVFWPCETWGFTQMFALFGWKLPLSINPGAVPFAALGYCSDSLIDWIFAQKFVPSFFKDILPPSDFQLMNVPKASISEVKAVAPAATTVDTNTQPGAKP